MPITSSKPRTMTDTTATQSIPTSSVGSKQNQLNLNGPNKRAVSLQVDQSNPIKTLPCSNEERNMKSLHGTRRSKQLDRKPSFCFCRRNRCFAHSSSYQFRNQSALFIYYLAAVTMFCCTNHINLSEAKPVNRMKRDSCNTSQTMPEWANYICADNKMVYRNIFNRDSQFPINTNKEKQKNMLLEELINHFNYTKHHSNKLLNDYIDSSERTDNFCKNHKINSDYKGWRHLTKTDEKFRHAYKYLLRFVNPFEYSLIDRVESGDIIEGLLHFQYELKQSLKKVNDAMVLFKVPKGKLCHHVKCMYAKAYRSQKLSGDLNEAKNCDTLKRYIKFNDEIINMFRSI